jgi:hypothetical protein
LSRSEESHPLAGLLVGAAFGRFPDADGGVEVLPSPPGPADAVVAFTGHAIVAADVSPKEVAGFLPPSDLGAPMSTHFLSWLGRRLGCRPGSLDVVFTAVGAEGQGELPLRPDSLRSDHPRVARAARYRTDVTVYSDLEDRAVIILGRGLARRWEVGFEIDARCRNLRLGRSIVAATRCLVPPGEPLFMQVAPGNAASMRAVIAGGFTPIGSEVLFVRTKAAG